jgi:cytochrome c oxidase subunit 3
MAPTPRPPETGSCSASSWGSCRRSCCSAPCLPRTSSFGPTAAAGRPGQERPELIIPGLNTLLLVTSSFTLQWAIRAIGQGDLRTVKRFLWVTILMGVAFISIQAYEFATNGFGLSDGVFGSTFYTLTGFHGAHVLAGIILMLIVANRARRGLISGTRHTEVEATSYYWHFVDVVWLFLFSTVYVL